MKKAVLVLCLLALFSCSHEKKTTQSTTVDTLRKRVIASNSHPKNNVSGEAASKSVPSANAGKWLYESKTDTEGDMVYKATTLSPDSLKFGFPYAPGSIARLTIRKRDNSTTLYLQVSNGQFNKSFQGGQARIRFDNQPAKTYSFSAAENGSASIIFFDAAQKLIDKMTSAKNMIIDVDFYAQGNRQIKFNTAGLKWNY